MKDYKYKAKRQDGSVVIGNIAALNEEAVASYIRRQGMYVADISLNTSALPSFQNLFEEKVNMYDVAVFCRQCATLLGAGIPLISVLDTLSKQSSKKRLQDVLYKITLSLREGKPLSTAMEEYPNIFPELLTNMVAAGETGGILETVMDRLATQFEKDYRMEQKFKGALVYPAIVLGVAAIVVGIIMFFVMPIFVDLFKSVGVELPWITQIVIGISTFITEYWYVIIGLTVLGYYGYKKILCNNKQFLLWRDGIFLKVPILGELYRKIIITRFARTFASLARSGVPILEAIAIVSKATGSLQANAVLEAARDSLRKGDSLAMPLEKSGMFSPLLISLVQTGEETGNLDTMLDKAADFYGAEADDMIANLQTLIDPILIVILGVVVGTLAIALLLPIFEIVTKIGRA